ncbi:MAG: signal recognition particle-docking protein FtsY [Phycisphaerales bacterium]
MSLFSRVISNLKAGLAKTRESLVSGLRLLVRGRVLDDSLLADIEKALLSADVGPAATAKLIDGLRADVKSGRLTDSALVIDHLKAACKAMLRGQGTACSPTVREGSGPGAQQTAGAGKSAPSLTLARAASGPTVILVTGINGAGKTTSVAKLAARLKGEGRSVMLAACDTFRAGAVRQLEIWSERLGVELIKGQMGGDPAAVAFDACKAAVARNVDYLIVDTAGRLQTQDPLMRQLAKIYAVLGKQIAESPHESLLVLDATSGQNAVRQACEFGKVAAISGIILAKLDGTAKGGVVLAINAATSIPVKFIGVGERPEDLEAFDPDTFVEALFES